MNERKAREGRHELEFWGRTLDSLGGRPPGTWLRNALGAKGLEDLDPDRIEVLCVGAYVEYREMMDGYYDVEDGDDTDDE
jgi:hypothetical protein